MCKSHSNWTLDTANYYYLLLLLFVFLVWYLIWWCWNGCSQCLNVVIAVVTAAACVVTFVVVVHLRLKFTHTHEPEINSPTHISWQKLLWILSPPPPPSEYSQLNNCILLSLLSSLLPSLGRLILFSLAVDVGWMNNGSNCRVVLQLSQCLRRVCDCIKSRRFNVIMSKLCPQRTQLLFFRYDDDGAVVRAFDTIEIYAWARLWREWRSCDVVVAVVVVLSLPSLFSFVLRMYVLTTPFDYYQWCPNNITVSSKSISHYDNSFPRADNKRPSGVFQVLYAMYKDGWSRSVS